MAINKYVFRSEAAQICKIDRKTWDKYVNRGELGEPDVIVPPKSKGYLREKVVAFKKRLEKHRRRGMPLLLKRKNAS